MAHNITYDDVLISPNQVSDQSSRFNDSQCNPYIFCNARGKEYLPFVSAPMDSIPSPEFIEATKDKIFAVFSHRFQPIEAQLEHLRLGAQAVIGLNTTIKDIETLINTGCQHILLDVANGGNYHVSDKLRTLQYLRKEGIYLWAGNVASSQPYNLLSPLCDFVRVGIGGGCFTPEQQVKTTDGLKAISEIQPNDYVFTHTGAAHKVKATISYWKEEEIQVVNDIRCTKNHEFFVVHKKNAAKVSDKKALDQYGYWIEAQHLDKNKHLLVEWEENPVKFKLKEIHTLETEEYLGVVHDLEVEHDHSYNIKGIAVHNSACTTRINTGVGVGNITAIEDCERIYKYFNEEIYDPNGNLQKKDSSTLKRWQKLNHEYPPAMITADGGIKTNGDICKALAAGSHLVMMGRQFAATQESAAPYLETSSLNRFSPFSSIDLAKKVYRGMASREVNEEHKQDSKVSIEGASGILEVTGSVKSILDQMEANLRSAMTYVNAHNLKEFREKASLKTISPAVMIESRAHAFK